MKKGSKWSEKARISIINGQKGHTGKYMRTDEIKKKVSGEKSHFWKGGISTYDRKLWLNNCRRILIKDVEGYHSQGEWETLKAQYNWTCPCCKLQEPFLNQKIRLLTEDHIIPIVKGGSHNIENIQPLCHSCNCRKHDKIIKYKK